MPTRKNVPKRTGDDATKQLRLNQSNQIAAIISALQAKLAEMTNNQRKQLALLESVSLGLYEEVDKLSKKAPAELVTDLVLTQTNDIIRETKQLVADGRISTCCVFNLPLSRRIKARNAATGRCVFVE